MKLKLYKESQCTYCKEKTTSQPIGDLCHICSQGTMQ